MTQHICPDCKNVFLQPFRCVTCGAQKLYDETLRHAEQRAERAEAELAAALADAERYRWMRSYKRNMIEWKDLSYTTAKTMDSYIDAKLATERKK